MGINKSTSGKATWFLKEIEDISDNLKEITVSFDDNRGLVTTSLNYVERPCFSEQQLKDYRTLYAGIKAALSNIAYEDRPVRYLLHTSSEPGIWCLGGDLDLFSRCIRDHDAHGLRSYGHDCADVGYDTHTGLGLSIITMCLVQGKALGGGFESARSCNLVFAEEHSTFGLPEIMFDMFPGMGALSYLAHKIGMPKAEEMVLSGKTHPAREIYELGGIDQIVPEGEGMAAVHAYIDRHARRHNAHAAIIAARQRARPIYHEEVRDIVDIWVECAMRVKESELKIMQRLVSAQMKLRSKRALAA